MNDTLSRYARTIDASKKVRWDIDRDVLRGRRFDLRQKFLPDGLTLVDELSDLLAPAQRFFLGQVQGRTYANMFGLVERFIGAKVAELGRAHALGDQVAFEALVRFNDEELKHQALFRRVEAMVADGMPEGYTFVPQPNDVAGFVLGKSTWAVLALTCHIELFSQAHYRESIAPAEDLSELFKDILLFHWKEESQHAVIDELEWRREDKHLSATERDSAIGELIELVGGVDAVVQAQAKADTRYFLRCVSLPEEGPSAERIGTTLLKAYRWQYIVSGAQHPQFLKVLCSLANDTQMARIGAALAPLAYATPARAAPQHARDEAVSAEP